ncbi:F0F1 ATP synthase subunit A [Candidatus Woesebacteria bacterium]|nr:MAG: F0F1 ATP synthase subunit A [Candidatus Woesebacteria bacterium]
MHEISIAAEEIAHIAGFAVTNSMLTTLVVSFLLIAVAIWAKPKFSLIPTKAISMIEIPVEAMYKLTRQIAPHNVTEFFPLITTIFIFVLFSNWIALLPGFGGIGLKHTVDHHESFTPLLRATTADINTTISLALIAVFGTHYYGLKHLGVKLHVSKYINVTNPIKFFVGFLELIGEVSKIISFSFRLFGNIFAGEVLLIVIGSLVPVIFPIPFWGLEIFVGLIQALVFSMLTLVFCSMAVSKH